MELFSKSILALLEGVQSRQKIRGLREVFDFYQWVEQQPKIETHVHVEAAVSAAFYRAQGCPPSWKDSAPWERAPFADLRAFILSWVDLTRCMTRLDQFEALVEEFVNARAREKIIYTEAYFSPADFSFMRKRFSIAPELFEFADVVAAYVSGLKKGLQKNPGIEVRLILDALWPSTREERAVMLDVLASTLENDHFVDENGAHYITAIGLGGAETHQDLDGHAQFVQQVRDMGFKVDIHSGEGNDANMHRRSVGELRPDRVAHGFAGAHEGFFYAQNLVMCPLSNLLLRTYSGVPEKHPVFELLQNNIPVCIGSDDPLLLGSNLSTEYAFLYAIDTNFSKDLFMQIQENTRGRTLSPGVCARVWS